MFLGLGVLTVGRENSCLLNGSRALVCANFENISCSKTLLNTFHVHRNCTNHRSVHLLDPAVREVDVVGPGGHRAVPLLVSTKVRAGVVVGDGVGVCVHLATSRSAEIRCQTFEKIVDLKEYKNRARCMCTVYTRPVHKNLFLEFPKNPGSFMLHFDR